MAPPSSGGGHRLHSALADACIDTAHQRDGRRLRRCTDERAGCPQRMRGLHGGAGQASGPLDAWTVGREDRLPLKPTCQQQPGASRSEDDK